MQTPTNFSKTTNTPFHLLPKTRKSKKMANMACPPINPTRIRILNPNPNPLITSSSNPVIYWMFRDQRASDNHALLHALHLSSSTSSPLAVAFNLFHPRFLNAAPRHLLFMLRGLRKLHLKLRALNVSFFLFHGNAVETIPHFAAKCNARVIVTDFSPLREVRRWKEEMVRRVDGLGIEVHEVDAHNVVPVWVASGKLEYGARTIRGKIGKLLGEYLVEFGEVGKCRVDWVGEAPQIDWDGLIAQVVSEGNGEVPEIGWCEPGEDAAMDVLMGSKDGFLTKRLKSYHTDRNNPLKPKALSCLSPYLHFGQISAQRCALMAKAYRSSNPQAIDAFLEELIIRRELADNFCYYQPQYDSVQGAWEWARKTLMDHAADKREHIYSKEQLEKGKTADPLWNASHLEMVHHGKMHGFLRMYWAKKILEWTQSPEEALSIAIYLNDKYSIDGRDPNGYVGCMWAICGIHDQGWRERPIFGKIRYMNYAGCKRKFDVDGYIAYVNRLVAESRKRKLGSTPSSIMKQPRLTSPEQSRTSGYCPSNL